jgi:nucleotide-binding universal stress UspA family protein
VGPKVVIAYEPGAAGRDALQLGRALADLGGGSLLIAHAFEKLTREPATLDEQRWVREQIGEIDRTVRAAVGDGEEFQTVPLYTTRIQESLHELARNENATFIVAGPTQRGRIAKRIIGTTSEPIAHEAPCPVAIASAGLADGGDVTFGKVGVAFDGSAESDRALALAAALGWAAGATLHAIAIEPVFPEMGGLTGEPARAELTSHVEAALGPPGAKLEWEVAVRQGAVFEALAAEARDQILDLLVCGSRDLPPLERVLQHSVSRAMLHAEICPLAIVSREAAVERAISVFVGAPAA